MAKGDVVGAMSADATVLEFQPAAGVECVITSVNKTFNLVDTAAQDNLPYHVAGESMKIFISNALWIRINVGGAGENTTYTGVQVK